jgi:hypothetical protein
VNRRARWRAIRDANEILDAARFRWLFRRVEWVSQLDRRRYLLERLAGVTGARARSLIDGAMAEEEIERAARAAKASAEQGGDNGRMDSH